MGFDYFSVEDAPSSEQVPVDITSTLPEDGSLPGHWNTMGHVETTSAATSKSYFRWSNQMAPIAAELLRLAGADDLDTAKPRVTDPTRKDPPEMGMLRSLNMGAGFHVTLVDGRLLLLVEIPNYCS